jgi:hypothetical protein
MYFMDNPLAVWNHTHLSLFPFYNQVHFTLTPNAQIWPRSQNAALSGTSSQIFLMINEIGGDDPGQSFIIGMAFMERFYAVFDTGNKQVGLAYTPFTNSTSN